MQDISETPTVPLAFVDFVKKLESSRGRSEGLGQR